MDIIKLIKKEKNIYIFPHIPLIIKNPCDKSEKGLYSPLTLSSPLFLLDIL